MNDREVGLSYNYRSCEGYQSGARKASKEDQNGEMRRLHKEITQKLFVLTMATVFSLNTSRDYYSKLWMPMVL